MTSRLEIVIENRINGVNDVKNSTSFLSHLSLVVSWMFVCWRKSLKFYKLELAVEFFMKCFKIYGAKKV